MSATVARQGGCVQLEQSNMRLASNVAKMATEGYSDRAIQDTRYRIQKPRAEVRKEMNWGVGFPGNEKVKAAMQ